MRRILRLVSACVAVVVASVLVSRADAELFINEIHFDPGSSGQLLDARDEYIELRGTPGMSLANHYLIFVENEDNEFHTDPTGNIENIFNLGSLSIGSNGFLLLRQDGNLYNDAAVASGTTNLEHNDGNASISNGWGNGAGSLVFHQGINNVGFPKVELENGGATAMLIRNRVDVGGGLVPLLNMDLDQGNDGLDSRPDSLQSPVNDWASKWDIVDSIGWLETAEIQYGRSYGRVTFSASAIGEPVFDGGPLVTAEMVANATEPESSFAGIGFEIEMLARWGNSTGYTAADWHATNLTVEFASGSAGVSTNPVAVIDLRQSGDPHPSDDFDPTTPAPQPGFIESSKGVPYGTKLLSLGSPNYLTGDFNKDGVIDAADYVVWRKTLNAAGSELQHPAADANHDFLVNATDLTFWRNQFGTNSGSNSGTGGSAGVPEPAMGWLVGIAVACILSVQRFRLNRPCWVLG